MRVADFTSAHVESLKRRDLPSTVMRFARRSAGAARPNVAAEGGTTIDTISFYSDGTADSAELLLRDKQGFRFALRINPITSRVKILDLGHE